MRQWQLDTAQLVVNLQLLLPPPASKRQGREEPRASFLPWGDSAGLDGTRTLLEWCLGGSHLDR